jgi:hypothetical protein
MYSRFKILALFATAFVVVMFLLTGLTFAVDNAHRLAVVLPRVAGLTSYFNPDQCRSYIKGLIFIAFLLLMFLWRALFLQEQK